MRYDGGKNGSGVFQRLICMMPPHTLYVEMFAGSAAVLRRKKPAKQSIAYEMNRATIRELATHLPPEYFLPWDFNSEWNGKGPLPGCGGTSIGFNHPGTFETSLEIFNLDAYEGVKSKLLPGAYTYGFHRPGDVLLYADPPYPDDVRSTKGKIYEFEMLTAEEHAGLCDLLLSLPCRVMVSGYENDLYNQKLKGWRKEQIPTTNRAGARVIETVWLNFPPPIELHDASHVGQNYRERWNITKRVRNWTGQLKKMSAGEQQAIFEALTVEREKALEAGRGADEKEMSKLFSRATKAAKKLTRPTTPKKAIVDVEEVALFEE